MAVRAASKRPQSAGSGSDISIALVAHGSSPGINLGLSGLRQKERLQEKTRCSASVGHIGGQADGRDASHFAATAAAAATMALATCAGFDSCGT